MITDLSGKDGNGVRVNGERQRGRSLTDGDVIELGRTRLKFESAPAYEGLAIGSWEKERTMKDEKRSAPAGQHRRSRTVVAEPHPGVAAGRLECGQPGRSHRRDQLGERDAASWPAKAAAGRAPSKPAAARAARRQPPRRRSRVAQPPQRRRGRARGQGADARAQALRGRRAHHAASARSAAGPKAAAPATVDAARRRPCAASPR